MKLDTYHNPTLATRRYNAMCAKDYPSEMLPSAAWYALADRLVQARRAAKLEGDSRTYIQDRVNDCSARARYAQRQGR